MSDVNPGYSMILVIISNGRNEWRKFIILEILVLFEFLFSPELVLAPRDTGFQ
jgi:hypothetical protein